MFSLAPSNFVYNNSSEATTILTEGDIGFDKQKAANLKVRAILLIEIKEYIRKKGLKQKEAAALLGINQPEVSVLMHDHIFKFSIDALVNMLTRIGRELKITTRPKKAA